MGILIMPATLLIAWLLALFGVAPPGAMAGDTSTDEMIRWMLFLPGGCMFVASAVMHTVFAKKTAANIGWTTNGFQYEIGFVSLGIGIAGIVASYGAAAAWLPISIVIIVFLTLAGVNHIVEMAKAKNFAPGNSLVLLYDFGLPISLVALLIATGGA